jgi:soluble lytic murein transglycosylase-like protein
MFGLLFVLAATHLRAAEMANLHNGFSIRDEYHETMGEITRLYIGKDASSGSVDVATSEIDSFDPAPPEPEPNGVQVPQTWDLNTIISAASARDRIDADFVASVVRAESANNPRAVSPKGAQGLMQLMPQTAKRLGVKDSFDPVDNIDGGVRYLRELLLRYQGDAVKALAAYNAGPDRVQQYNGVPPYRETRAYIARVIADYNRKKLANSKPQIKSASRGKSTVPRLSEKRAGATKPGEADTSSTGN